MEMFISDTHFGHENILSSCRPQFQTIEEMNATIIDNINRKMKRSDTLYILGDFAFRNAQSAIECLEAIQPQKILIQGNHDKDWLKALSKEEIDRLFLGVYQQFSIKRNKIEIHMNHFPQLAWNRSHFFGESFSVCGHIHNARDTSVAARLFPLVKGQFNAGVDINHFEPVTFEELVANNVEFYHFSYTEEEQAKLAQAIKKVMA